MFARAETENRRIAELLERFSDVQGDIIQTLQDIASGTPNASETPERMAAYAARLSGRALTRGRVEGLEAAIDGNETLSTEWLEKALLAKRPVGRVNTPVENGTGFQVAPGILLTNNHVLSSVDRAWDSHVTFGLEHRRVLPNPVRRDYNFRPDVFFATDAELDFTFVAMEPSSDEPDPAIQGYLPLIDGEGKVMRGDRLAIIHHPSGAERAISLHRSHLVAILSGGAYDAFLWHTCDTAKGSSGAPVFSLDWEVVGLHRRAVPNDDPLIEAMRSDLPSPDARWVFNEATRISRVLNRLETLSLDEQMRERLEKMRALWSSRRAPREGLLAAREGLLEDGAFA